MDTLIGLRRYLLGTQAMVCMVVLSIVKASDAAYTALGLICLGVFGSYASYAAFGKKEGCGTPSPISHDPS